MTLVADDLVRLSAEAVTRVGAAASLDELEALETEYLGRSHGKISGLMRGIGALPAAERPTFGQRMNAAKSEISAQLDRRRAELSAVELDRRLHEEAIDVTLPGRAPVVGR